ncbi:UNVERIFIED_CONTAM: hypothetical protein RMT77_008131 [Armadillidium vulgare]
MIKFLKFFIISFCCFLLMFFIHKYPSMWKNSLLTSKISCNHHDFLSRLEGPLMGDDPSLVSFLRKNFLNPPSKLPYNITLFRKPGTSFPFLGNINFKSFILETFHNTHEPGFFVEAGALDGEVGSNTLWLEYNKNWTGLLIEPNRESCKVLRSKHRKAWSSCSCISPKKFAEKSLFEIPNGHDIDYHRQWLLRANVRSYNSRFHTHKDLFQQTAAFTYSRAQCFPLITYLLALNITKIDLLSLDTQGGEKNMLFNFPFDKVKVKYMFIEYLKKGPVGYQKDDEMVAFLESKGLKLLDFSERYIEYIFGPKDLSETK